MAEVIEELYDQKFKRFRPFIVHEDGTYTRVDLTEEERKTLLTQEEKQDMKATGYQTPVIPEATSSEDYKRPVSTSIQPSGFEDDKPSISDDIERIGTGLYQAIPRLASDFIARPIASAFDKTEEYDKAALKVFKATAPEGVYDDETGRIKDTETLVGSGLDLATFFVGGGFIYKTLDKIKRTKDLSKFKKALISEQAAEQILVRDPVTWNMLTNAKDVPVLEYLAGDQEDDVLLNRAKMGISHGIILGSLLKGGGGLLNAFKKSGFSKTSVKYHAQKMFNKDVEELSEVEVEQVTEAILKAKRKKEISDPSDLVKNMRTVLEDDADGIAQMINQNESFIHKFTNRFFKTRGFFSTKAKELQQDSIHRVRQNEAEARHIAFRLKSFMEKLSTGKFEVDKTLPSKVSDALEDTKLFKMSADKKINYLKKKYKFSDELAEEVTSARSLIDDLSKRLLDSNIGSEVIQASIAQNMGQYLTRSYRLFEDKNFRPDPDQMERAREAMVRNKIGDVDINDVDSETLLRFRNEAEIDLQEIISMRDAKTYTDYITNVRKINRDLLTGKKEIDFEIRKFMGEIKDPTEQIMITTKKLSTIVETNNFFKRFEALAGSAPKDPIKFSAAVKEARLKLQNSEALDVQGDFIVRTDGSVGKKVTDEKMLEDFNVDKDQTLAFFKDANGKQTPYVLNADDFTPIAKDSKVNSVAHKLYRKNGGEYTDSKYVFKTKLDIPKKADGTLDPKLQERYGTKITGTGSSLDGQYTTPEVARALANNEDTFIVFGNALKNVGAFQYFGLAKGLNQQMRTVYDHTTQLRNGLGGLQFGLANGINPLKNGKLNFDILKQEIKKTASNKDFNSFYEKMLDLGVINTSVRLNEARALIGIADEIQPVKFFEKLSSVAKKYDRSGNISKWGKTAKDLPEDIYMATDDFFKMNAYLTELDFLKKAYPSLTKTAEGLAELEKRAANKIKNTMPNYDRVPQGIKALRELPLGNFVSFPAEIIRTSAHILRLSADEMLSGNAIMARRGAQRLAGFTTTNLGWYTGGKESAKLLGFNNTETEALNTLAENPKFGQEEHNNIWSVLEDNEGNNQLHLMRQKFTNSYNDVTNAAYAVDREITQGKLKGDDAFTIGTNAAIEGIKTFLEPYTTDAMFAKSIKDIYEAMEADDGRTSDGKKIYVDKDIDTLIYGTFEHLGKAFAPGFVLDATKAVKSLMETPNKVTGKPDNKTARFLELTTGISFSQFDADDSFTNHAKQYLRTLKYTITKPSIGFGESSEDYGNRYIKATGDKYEATQNFYRYVVAMRTLGKNNADLRVLLNKAGFSSKNEIAAILDGRFITDDISGSKYMEIQEKASDKENVDTTIMKLNTFRDTVNQSVLHPITDGENEENNYQITYARLLKDDIKLKDFDELQDKGILKRYSTGGEVEVPNAPAEPDERIDKFTGLPYNMRAGTAYMDADDPLRRLGFMGGGAVDPLSRLGFGLGGIAKLGGKALQALKNNKQTLMVKPHGDDAGYINVATKENVTGETVPNATISGVAGKKGVVISDPVTVPQNNLALEALKKLKVVGQTGSKTPEKIIGNKYVTNLARPETYNWKKNNIPKGIDPTADNSLVVVEGSKKHLYALKTEYPEGVNLTHYPDKTENPRFRPTTYGNLKTGDIVGYMISTISGKTHPVYDNIIITTGRLKEFDGGMVKKALSAIANVRPKVEGFFFNKLFDDKAKANLGFSKDESIYEWVNNIGKDRYSKDSQIYGEQDAARHAALAWTSNQATYLKNTLNKQLEEREKSDKYGGAMDLANNAIGAKLTAKNKAEAEQQIYKLIEENKLQYMNPEERKIANQKYLEDQYGVRVMEK